MKAANFFVIWHILNIVIEINMSFTPVHFNILKKFPANNRLNEYAAMTGAFSVSFV